jgi:hypothetical protein
MAALSMVSTFLLLRRAATLAGAALSLLLTLAPPARAQAAPALGHCLLLPLDPGSRAQQAALIVEGEVLDARSFWDAGHRRLYTRHRLRVFSLLKGRVADTTALTLITEGGRLGLDQQVLTNTLHLAAGQQGVFFLSPAGWAGLPTGAAGPPWAAVGSEQGFIEYSLTDGTAAEPFRSYPAVDAAFYQQLTDLTGQPRRVLRPNLALRAVQAARAASLVRRGTTAPTISALQPSQLPAGIGAVLTITGSDFGPTRGGVEFKNADDGGASWVQARAADYVSWDNNRIQVRVPSRGEGGGRAAGSGPVRVLTSSQLLVESPAAVTIIYALTNVENDTHTLLQRPNHVAQEAGGLAFHFGPNFGANAAAAAAWQRALATWRCQSFMNWRVGSPAAANTIADDGANVVAFDGPGDELPDRVLGRTTSYYRGCFAPSGEVVFWVQSVDMQFDAATNFQFGPALANGATGQVDFETVTLHELGHAQQLSHLILSGAVMHYSVAPGRNTRILNPGSDVAGGRKVLRERSFHSQSCGGPALLPAPLTSFSAQLAGAGVDLRWTTHDECALPDFRVERSLGADTTAGSWEAVGTVPAGQASGEYQLRDAQPLAGLHFYRLGLRRADGSLDYAEPVALSTEEATAVIVFPNPVLGGQLRLQFPAAEAGTLSIRVYDELGRQQQRSTFFAQPGLNVLTLNIDKLNPGFYVLRWRDAQGREGSRKFVRH